MNRILSIIGVIALVGAGVYLYNENRRDAVIDDIGDAVEEIADNVGDAVENIADEVEDANDPGASS